MRALLCATLLLGVAGTASAEEYEPVLYLEGDGTALPGAEPEAAADVSNIIFLNRCIGGCTITKAGANNSLADQSWFPQGDQTTYNLNEFSHDDATWNAILECVQDVYSAFDVVVTDVDPGNEAHTEVYVAGLDENIGIDGAGGVGGPKSGAGGSDPCTAVNNNVAFAFANGYPASAIEYMCGVIAQESGHSFGIPDHMRDCRDPMSYSYYGPCGSGERGFFRNVPMECVDTGGQPSTCQCGGRANNHSHIVGIFGESGVTPPPTTVSIGQPQDGGTITATSQVSVGMTAHRGVFKVELYFNGWLWATWNAPEGPGPGDGWPIPATLIDPPDTFPDGVIDVEVRAYDDIGTMASDSVQVTKGAPCTSADTCLDGQQCADGKCFWDAPSAETGDACEFDQQCIGPNVYDGTCGEGSDGTKICTKACYAGPGADCAEGFHCEVTNASDNSGVCWPDEPPPGCCSTGSDPGAPLAPLAFAALVGVLVLRRRRPV
jgi:MYXO-CTERM domain-containing protein